MFVLSVISYISYLLCPQFMFFCNSSHCWTTVDRLTFPTSDRETPRLVNNSRTLDIENLTSSPNSTFRAWVMCSTSSAFFSRSSFFFIVSAIRFAFATSIFCRLAARTLYCSTRIFSASRSFNIRLGLFRILATARGSPSCVVLGAIFRFFRGGGKGVGAIRFFG